MTSLKKYKTLELDIIATLIENGQTVRKRAKGTITARLGNGHRASVPSEGALAPAPLHDSGSSTVLADPQRHR